MLTLCFPPARMHYINTLTSCIWIPMNVLGDKPFESSLHVSTLQNQIEGPQCLRKLTWIGSFQHLWRATLDPKEEQRERMGLNVRENAISNVFPFSGNGSRASPTESMAIFFEIVQESIPHALTCPFRIWITFQTGAHPEKSINSICAWYSFVQEKVVVVECSRVFFEWGG